MLGTQKSTVSIQINFKAKDCEKTNKQKTCLLFDSLSTDEVQMNHWIKIVLTLVIRRYHADNVTSQCAGQGNVYVSS